MEKLHDGDMVRFDYELYVDGVLRETSMLASAERANILQKGRTYKPYLFTLGLGQIVLGLEEDIKEHGMEALTDEPLVAGRRIQVPADKAYGKRRADLLVTVPTIRFREKPQLGMQVQHEGRNGIVTKVGGGRATIDLHHELAGRDLEYAYWVRGVHRDGKSRVEALVDQHLGPCPVHWQEEGATTVLLVVTPPHIASTPAWGQNRGRLVDRMRFAMDGQPLTVMFHDAFMAPKPPPPKPAPAVPEEPTPEEGVASEP